MTKERIWATAGMDDGSLCIGCLEARLGRQLTPADETGPSARRPRRPDVTAEEKAALIIEKARSQQKDLILEAKEEKIRLQREAEDEARAKRTELGNLERRLLQRDEQLDQRADMLEGRDRKLIDRERAQGPEAALAAIKKPAANWQINIMKDRNDHVASLYSVSKIPHLFMIGRDGKVAANHLGYGDRTIEELVADINRALAEPVPAGQ